MSQTYSQTLQWKGDIEYEVGGGTIDIMKYIRSIWIRINFCIAS